MLNDLLDEPDTAYVEMHQQKYLAEQELADRYRSFVAEILRLSLGGLAVFSFIYKQDSHLPDNLAAKDICSLLGIVMFALSAMSALFFLYCASEGLRWYIAGLRNRSIPPDKQPANSKEYLTKRKKWIKRCRLSKLLAALMLALGGVCMASAIVLTFFRV